MNIKKIASAIVSGVFAFASISAYTPLDTYNVSAVEYTGSGDPANAVYKNTITIDTVTLTESEAKIYAALGTEIEIGVNIGSEGEGVRFSATGLSNYYDERLEIVKYSNSKSTWTNGTLSAFGGYVETYLGEYNNHIGLFVSNAFVQDIDQSGVLYKFKFRLPANVAVGDYYPVNIEYNPGDRFTYVVDGTSDAELGDEAWTFTNGITNGGIKIVEDDQDIRGDVNGDRIIDARDASLILEHYSSAQSGWGTLTEEQRQIADFNGDGSVDSSDAALIIQVYAITQANAGTIGGEYSGGGDASVAINKNTLTVDTVTLPYGKAQIYASKGTPITIGVNVASEGSGVKFASAGLSFYYDNRLTPVANKGKYLDSDLVYGLSESELTSSDDMNGLFAATYCGNEITNSIIDTYGTNTLYTMQFKLPEDVKLGTYPIEIRYNSGDIFVNMDGISDAALAEQAWTFTEGVTNGAIIIVEDEVTTTTTTTTTTSTTTTTTTTTAPAPLNAGDYTSDGHLVGDVNNDGMVDSSDAALILKYYAEKQSSK